MDITAGLHDGSLGIIRQPWDGPFTSLDKQNSHNATLLLRLEVLYIYKRDFD